MKIDIDHVAKLAKLPLTSDEKAHLAPQLEKIVEFIEELSELNTDNVAPTFQVTGKVNELREDKVVSCLTQEDVLSNAKTKEGDYITTSSVLNGN